ncbi:hypothetical protein A33M_0897 [Rhodovulum sp. PH10]|uniref:hypothetical protein n=1 Tax=Rhodovulum sp. PH10 TaxID=1187851 RepID=UPI00027C2EB5|nr:hypothetical protein [Rhodovulum sp. PH10]EJW09802.1 hypothetical protein A33M_0897 [Rhodovulum sp. PH10]
MQMRPLAVLTGVVAGAIVLTLLWPFLADDRGPAPQSTRVADAGGTTVPQGASTSDATTGAGGAGGAGDTAAAPQQNASQPNASQQSGSQQSGSQPNTSQQTTSRQNTSQQGGSQQSAQSNAPVTEGTGAATAAPGDSQPVVMTPDGRRTALAPIVTAVPPGLAATAARSTPGERRLGLHTGTAELARQSATGPAPTAPPPEEYMAAQRAQQAQNQQAQNQQAQNQQGQPQNQQAQNGQSGSNQGGMIGTPLGATDGQPTTTGQASPLSMPPMADSDKQAVRFKTGLACSRFLAAYTCTVTYTRI